MFPPLASLSLERWQTDVDRSLRWERRYFILNLVTVHDTERGGEEWRKWWVEGNKVRACWNVKQWKRDQKQQGWVGVSERNTEGWTSRLSRGCGWRGINGLRCEMEAGWENLGGAAGVRELLCYSKILFHFTTSSPSLCCPLLLLPSFLSSSFCFTSSSAFLLLVLSSLFASSLLLLKEHGFCFWITFLTIHSSQSYFYSVIHKNNILTMFFGGMEREERKEVTVETQIETKATQIQLIHRRWIMNTLTWWRFMLCHLHSDIFPIVIIVFYVVAFSPARLFSYIWRLKSCIM